MLLWSAAAIVPTLQALRWLPERVLQPVGARKKNGVSDRVPQHDPPPDGELVQPEVDERGDSLVVEGDDTEHVLPPTELDPYTPDPAPPNGKARGAIWVALAVVAAVVVVIAVLALR
jgi:hypothetical protein